MLTAKVQSSFRFSQIIVNLCVLKRSVKIKRKNALNHTVTCAGWKTVKAPSANSSKSHRFTTPFM